MVVFTLNSNNKKEKDSIYFNLHFEYTEHKKYNFINNHTSKVTTVFY